MPDSLPKGTALHSEHRNPVYGMFRHRAKAQLQLNKYYYYSYIHSDAGNEAHAAKLERKLLYSCRPAVIRHSALFDIAHTICYLQVCAANARTK